MAATLDLKSKEEKDSELDKRIEALRRKNEALIRRYQEIEEDRKKAELEGVAVTAPRKGRSLEKEDVAADMEKNLGPPRRSPGAHQPSGASKGGRPPPRQGSRTNLGRGPHGWEDTSGEQPRRAGGRGRRGRGRGSPHLSGAGDASTSDRRSKEWEERRRQNIEKMNEEMEKIAEYERNQREGVLEPNPVRNFLDDPRRRSGPLEEPERDRREGSRRHGRNWGGTDFERVRCGLEQERQGRRAGLGGAGDMTLSMTGRERSEYLRWKQEREKIDQERLQRHRKPTGQWRREWDAEKTDGMFKDGPPPAPSHEATHRYDDQAWARPPKPPTFGEFLSQHKAEVSNRRRKNSRPQAKAAPRVYSDHDDRWESKEEAVSPAPEALPPPAPKETLVQPPETQALVHRPPEDEGEEDCAGEEGEEDDDDGVEEDEEWEDVSEDVTEEEEEEPEEEEGAEEPEQAQAQDHSILEAEPIRDPTVDQANPAPPRPQESLEPGEPEEPQEPQELSPAPATPSSPFSTPTGHQPVPDWGGDQPAPAFLESGPNLPGAQKAEEEGSEATPEAGPKSQEMAEITDFHRASPNS
ncbi:coiled-coil domain-containing protein 9 isoform X2 [Perognathus longimembris pacificus]|nr:coiled-coil domain-containing protein 9 isoform X2 [Perognathus longimembris pacificus]XP_048225155.1 coiled-coil domain-containing protein 9 isoform X2 [Perognathus longimembris pacificus]XP_048225156.1 coiled-coil domain-containing protein 9 isoform X2 [Perognathus longimembris pacificus]XP_048225157.1 coiled-coil domain-containing protein 9 isoform X2 [Perognathus longimembris pacificus]XP_048225158.1 coiled-coil domain-containing protein 9 isoform X2 [Perognathus longimembris pacificus]